MTAKCDQRGGISPSLYWLSNF